MEIKAKIQNWIDGPQDYHEGLNLLRKISKKQTVMGKMWTVGRKKNPNNLAFKEMHEKMFYMLSSFLKPEIPVKMAKNPHAVTHYPENYFVIQFYIGGENIEVGADPETTLEDMAKKAILKSEYSRRTINSFECFYQGPITQKIKLDIKSKIKDLTISDAYGDPGVSITKEAIYIRF